MFSDDTSQMEHLHLNKCWYGITHATIQNEVMATKRNEILQMWEGRKQRLVGKGSANMKPVSYGVKLLYLILGAESPAQLTKVHIYQGRREAESFFL